MRYLWVYPVCLLGLSAVHMLAPQRDGWLALTQIVAPYLFLPLVVLLPIAIRSNRLALRLALIGCGLLGSSYVFPSIASLRPQASPAAEHFEAMTWNLDVDNQQTDEIRRVLGRTQASVVALQELAPQHAEAISRDRALMQRYPWRVLRPHGRMDAGLLSTYPILGYGTFQGAEALWARLRLDSGQTMLVVSGHLGRMPITGFQLFDDWPIPYRVDPASRDATIRELRAAAGWLRRPGEPLLLVGDWDVTEREPAYNDLTYGLYDAQALVGTGAGNTWRPGRFKGLPFGLLRIDYLLSTPAIVPLQTWVDCAPRGSDHCILSGRFAVEPDANRRLTATDRSPIR